MRNSFDKTIFAFDQTVREGVAIMCKAMEDMRNQTLKDGMIDVARRMLADGTLSLEKIAEYSALSIEEIEALEKNCVTV